MFADPQHKNGAPMFGYAHDKSDINTLKRRMTKLFETFGVSQKVSHSVSFVKATTVTNDIILLGAISK